MGFKDRVLSFVRREPQATPDLLGELTPAERQRLNSTQYDPEAVGDRVGDKTWVSQDIIKSMGERDRPTERGVSQDNAHDRLLAEFGKQMPVKWEVFGSRQILPVLDERSKESGGTMDSEVKTAKQHVREREQERWNRVEQVGRQAIDSDRARVTEKQAATTKADEDTERPRPRMMP